MEYYGQIQCSVTIEVLNKYGQATRRENANNSLARLGRDEFRDIVLKINSTSYPLVDFKIFHKFVRDGRASIVFTKTNTNIFFSNVPPEELSNFLKILKVKTDIHKGAATDRMKLYSSAKKSFEDISPLTVLDVNKYRGKGSMKSPVQTTIAVKRKSSHITPIRDTKGRTLDREGARKRLNSTPLTVIKLGEKTPIPNKKVLKRSDDGKTPSMNLNKKVNLTSNLTAEQSHILGVVKQGLNVFFTGSAGTGKSYLLRKIIGSLPPDCTVASASTGVAACQIGGVTLHAFAGIGNGEGTLEHCIQLASRPSATRNWKKCQTLIIDEISMVDASFFEKLEKIACVIRNDERPFGGIQLVLCGDFLQLPPVKKNQDTKFCFQAKCWSSCVQVNFELTDIKRQNDQEFINILQYIRVGKCPDPIYEKLVYTQHNKIEKFGIEATRLCTHKDSVEEINKMKMDDLPGKKKLFVSIDSDPEYTKQMDKCLQVDHKLNLKIGAQVMLTKNLDVSRGLVNGARGVVLKFTSDGLPVVKFSQGIQLTLKREKFVYKTPGGVIIREQLPLKLAWAISIHKSQGLTLDCCEVSLARVFEHGQAYVALSRAKSLDGLRVLDINRSCVKAHTDVLKFYIRLRREIKMTSFLNKENETPLS